MFKNSLRSARWTAALLAPLLLVTACGDTEEKAKVPAEKIVGTWTAADGETFSFAADRTFTSTGLDAKKLASARCPGGKATGSWAFFADQGDGLYGTSEKARSGDEIGLAFDKEPQESCTMNLSVVDGGKTLCATDDPDLPCGLDVRFTRKK